MPRILTDTVAARKRRKFIVLALFAIALVLLVATIVWWRSLPREAENPATAQPLAPTILTAADLFAAYENDPSLRGLADVPLLVTASLATTPSSGSTVLLQTPDPLLNIAADVVPSDAVRLADTQPGAEVVLLCEGAAPGLRAPTLEGCRLQIAAR